MNELYNFIDDLNGIINVVEFKGRRGEIMSYEDVSYFVEDSLKVMINIYYDRYSKNGNKYEKEIYEGIRDGVSEYIAPELYKLAFPFIEVDEDTNDEVIVSFDYEITSSVDAILATIANGDYYIKVDEILDDSIGDDTDVVELTCFTLYHLIVNRLYYKVKGGYDVGSRFQDIVFR